MEMTPSRLTVHDLPDKISSDKILEAVTDDFNNIEHNMAFVGEFVLAINMPKDAAMTLLMEEMIKAEFNIVSLSSGVFTSQAKDKDVYAEMRGYQRSKYSTLYARFWCSDVDVRRDFERWVNKVFHNKLVKGTVCGLRWAYGTKQGLGTTYVEELLTDVVLDEAYPNIIKEFGSLKAFAVKYLESDESVLLLQGPPGTGKSRLIRYLMTTLVEMRKVTMLADEYGDSNPNSKSLVMYTSDTDSLEGDELFAHFMTGEEVMFVVEDADNMLRPRTSGNDHLHRFLTVSDGIIRNVGRKVIFTTNLPNLKDVDEALIRPGRCFSALSLGGFNIEEALMFMEKLSNNNKDALRIVANHFKTHKTMTLAEAYKAFKILPK